MTQNAAAIVNPPAPADADIRLVCFDLGGVLVRICRSWPEGCEAAGLPVREQTHTPDLRTARRTLSMRYAVGEGTLDDFAEGVVKLVANRYTAEEIRAIHRAWLIGEYPDVQPLVHEIHSAGLPTACLSNTNDAHWRQMLGPDPDLNADGSLRFPVVHALQIHRASHIMRLAKPDPAIYRQFESDVDLPGRHILFFDDLPDNVAAARAAGWNVVQIDHASPTAPQIKSALRDFRIL